MKIKLKSFNITLLIVLLFISEIFQLKITFLKYTDEIICVIGVIYLIFNMVMKKKKIDKGDSKILLILSLVVIIGILGNMFYDVEKNIYYIIIDIVSTTKALIVYVFAKNYLTKETAKQVTRSLLIFSKIFIIFSAIFSVLSQSVDLDMVGEKRFGIKGFNFIFPYQHVLAIYLMSFVLFIAINSKDNSKTIKKYVLIAFISQIMTTKGPSIIWCALIVLLFKYYDKNKKISKLFIFVITAICIVLGQYQIKNYFLNENAPRALLLKYGIITALKFKPIGAGFATYGSDSAIKDYSKLYIEYGFNKLYGMNENNGIFLNDNYWPTLLGEFGFIGTILMMYVYYYLFRKFQQINCNKYVKTIIISNYIYILIHSLGSAAITSSASVFLFLTFGIYEKIYKDEDIGTKIKNKTSLVNEKIISK